MPKLSSKFFLRFHIFMMIAWLCVTPVTLLFPDSVLWVAIMSQYANFVGHFAAMDAARAEDANNKAMHATLQGIFELAVEHEVADEVLRALQEAVEEVTPRGLTSKSG